MAGFNFDKNSVQRIASAVKAVERAGAARGNGGGGDVSGGEWFDAKLTGEDPANPGRYKWDKSDIANGVLGDGNPPHVETLYDATEINGTRGFACPNYVRMRFAGYDAGGNAAYLFEFHELLTGTWVPADNSAPACAAHVPAFSTVEVSTLKQYFISDDYRVTEQNNGVANCNPGTVLFENKYNTFIHQPYGGADEVAPDTKIVRMLEETSTGAAKPTTATLVNPSATSNRYSVYFTMAAENEVDPASARPGYLRNGVTIKADTYIDPPPVSNQGGSSLGGYAILSTGPGVVATLAGTTATLTWSGMLAVETNGTTPIGVGSLTTGGGFTTLHQGSGIVLTDTGGGKLEISSEGLAVTDCASASVGSSFLGIAFGSGFTPTDASGGVLSLALKFSQLSPGGVIITPDCTNGTQLSWTGFLAEDSGGSAVGAGSLSTGGGFTTLKAGTNVTLTDAGGGVLLIDAAGGSSSYTPSSPSDWTAIFGSVVPSTFGQALDIIANLLAAGLVGTKAISGSLGGSVNIQNGVLTSWVPAS